MIEYVQAGTLVALLVFAIFYEKLSRSKFEELPDKADEITDQISKAAECLDDIADMINEFGVALNNSPVASSPSSPIEMILASFMSKMGQPNEHGTKTHQRKIHEIDPTPTLETEDEPWLTSQYRHLLPILLTSGMFRH